MHIDFFDKKSSIFVEFQFVYNLIGDGLVSNSILKKCNFLKILQFLSKIWLIFVYCKKLSALLCFVLFSGILGGFFVLFLNLRYIIKYRLSFLEIFLFKICLSDPNYCIILVNYTMLKFRPSFGSKISTYFSVNTIF